ncbi:MAG: dephospho-CoA kinase [Bacteroidetes bacterium]|nr:dephospho-CoA kinase [Bacteroidota bacterium]
MKVGVTGGMGSGKTRVCQAFSALGVPVFHADEEAKKLYEEDEIKTWLSAHISEKIFDHQGQVDRQKLAAIIFSDPLKIKLLEEKIHPIVASRFGHWYQAHRSQPYVLYEAAILFETGRYKQLDYTILVTAPKDVRIERIKLRDGHSTAEIEARMQRQWEDEKKIPLADFIINNIDWPDTLREVERIHQILIQKASKNDFPDFGKSL